MSSVYRDSGDKAKDVKTLYVSVDPDRDTPEVLKADLASFHVDALGLTGTKAEIDKVVDLFGASYEIIPTPNSAAKYTVAHTTYVYAIDAHGQTRDAFSYDATVDEIAEGLRKILPSGGA